MEAWAYMMYPLPGCQHWCAWLLFSFLLNEDSQLHALPDTGLLQLLVNFNPPPTHLPSSDEHQSLP